MPPAKSDIHLTPDRVFELIKEYWGYSKDEMFDPCPLNPQWDALEIPWKKVNFVNPPYSLLNQFTYKAIDEAADGKITIMLLPCKTDQLWFHDNFVDNKNCEIKWIRKRLKFKNNKWSATQPHFLVKVSSP